MSQSKGIKIKRQIIVQMEMSITSTAMKITQEARYNTNTTMILTENLNPKSTEEHNPMKRIATSTKKIHMNSWVGQPI